MNILGKIGSEGQKVNWITKKEGIDMATITNIKDPDKLNRVKCKLISDDKELGETDWCPVMTPFGGKENGIFFFPNVGDIVVLAYLGGDVHRPCVIGSLWTKEQTTPYKIEEKNDKYSIKTPLKSELLFDDTKDKQKITITTPKGTVISMDDEKELINISDKDKKNKLDMNLKSGEITMEADKKISLICGNAKIILETNGNITIDAQTKIAMKSATIEGKASGKVELTADGTATYKANGSMTVQSSGITTIKGSMVKIN